jgi:DNA-binding CsgD family transcriptional regulator
MAIIAAMPRVSSPVFVGRADELDRLCHALDEAGEHRPATRLIAGEAGIGKTRLVAEFADRARDDGAHVLVGGCFEVGGTGLPYAPFVAALRPLLRRIGEDRLNELIGPGRAELARLLPDLGHTQLGGEPNRPDRSLEGTAAQARLFEIVLGLLRRLSEEATVLLVIEDLHWADASTRDLLGFLVRSIRDTRFVCVATYRSDELHRRHALRPLLAELQRLQNVDDIELGGFGKEELTEQIAGITGERPDPGMVDAVLDRSGGNPFFVEELVAAGDVRLALPRSLRDTLDDRLRQLTPEAQRVLRVASVAGQRVDHRILAGVIELSEEELLDAVREAVDHHLLVPSAPDEPPGYAFRHALVQEAAYEDLLPSERTQLHAAFAQAIETDARVGVDDPSGRAALLAHHWLMAHDLERALPAALEAGRAAAASFAFADARAYLDRALELWPKVDPGALPGGIAWTTVLEEAAEASAQAGDARRSIDLVRTVLDEIDPVTDPLRAGILQHRLAWYLNESGDWQAGVVALERAADLIPIDPPTHERARVVADLAHSLMVRGRFGDSLALAEAALAISRAVDAPVAEARALNALGLDLASRSDFERGIAILRDAHAQSIDLRDPLAIFLTGVGLGWTLDECARHAEAYEVAIAARGRIAMLGADARFGGLLASKAGRALHELGRWDDASELLDQTIAAGPTRYALRWLLSNRIRLRTTRGDVSGAREDVAAYDALGERIVGIDPDLIVARRAELALAEGQAREARALVRATLEGFVEPDLDTDARNLMLLALRAELAELEAARGSRDRAREVDALERVDEVEEALGRHFTHVAANVPRPARVIGADRDLATAIVRQARGRDDDGAWEMAVEGRRALGRPFELGWVLHRAAIAHLAERRREDGAAELIEAHAIAVELGAFPLRAASEALARRAGIGLEGVETADDAADRLGLTRREREVLALLAAGRTNRQIGDQLFMAESTAGVHVSHILGKLGVARRSEAAALADRLGLRQLG